MSEQSRLQGPKSAAPAINRSSRMLQRQCACGAHTIGGAMCEACRRGPQSLQGKLVHEGAADASPPIVSRNLHWSGRVREATTREPAERGLANDFSELPPHPEEAPNDAHRLAQEGFAGSAGPLPHLDRIQRSFGPHHDLAHVKAHTGREAANAVRRLGAEAYASGDRIAFGGIPSLRTAAHEAAHIVQQRVGVQVPGGIGEAGDRYEQHADAVAERVAQGRSSKDLLVEYAADGGKASWSGRVVQMSPKSTRYGRMIDTIYNKTFDGVEIQIEFEPGASVDAKKIGMVQSIKAVGNGSPILTDPSQESRYVSSGPGAGYRIDRVTSANNPIYGAASLGAGKGLADTGATNAPSGTTPSTSNATYEIGYHYQEGGALKKKNAWLYDAPTRAASNNSNMTFETTALAIEGAQQGTYYGSVKWGWERDAGGVLKQIDFERVSEGMPSQNFLAPAAAWNKATARGTVVARNEPTQVYKMSGGAFVADYTIQKGTKVATSGSIGGGAVEYRIASIVDGPKAGSTGYIKVPDLQDKGDGAATVDLPVPDVHVIDPAAGVKLNEGVEGPWRDWDPLPKGTRVVVTGKTTTLEQWGKPAQPGVPPTVMKWVEVVEGPLTGKGGYVPETALKKERP